MVTEFEFPDVGEGVTEGTLIKWLVEEGDEVEEDESLAEVETDKAVVEVPSPEHATVLELHAEEGDTITVGDVIVTLGDDDESSGAASNEPSGDSEEPEELSVSSMTVSEAKDAVESGELDPVDVLDAEKEGKERTTLIGWLEDRIEMEQDGEEDAGGSTSVVGRLDDADQADASDEEPSKDTEEEDTGSTADTSSDTGPDGSSGKVLATPATRRLAREKDVDIGNIEGSGPGGRVTKEDVLTAAEGGQEAPEPSEEVEEEMGKPETPERSQVGPSGGLGTPNRFPPKEYDFEQYGDVERQELSGTRKAIAKNMERSKYTAPHVTSTDDADVTDLWEVREKEKEVAETRGVHLTFMPFIVKATISALREYPLMNASLDEETGEIVKKDYYNIGIAVATDDGLMVPNIKNADRKSILRIAKEMNELAEEARDHDLSLDEMRGGTFTITNYGSIGGRYGTPIINYPEVAILGTGTISREPVARNGDIAIRRILPLSVTFDHRVVDGAYVAHFMNELIKHLEDPDLLLLD